MSILVVIGQCCDWERHVLVTRIPVLTNQTGHRTHTSRTGVSRVTGRTAVGRLMHPIVRHQTQERDIRSAAAAVLSSRRSLFLMTVTQSDRQHLKGHLELLWYQHLCDAGLQTDLARNDLEIIMSADNWIEYTIQFSSIQSWARFSMSWAVATFFCIFCREKFCEHVSWVLSDVTCKLMPVRPRKFPYLEST